MANDKEKYKDLSGKANKETHERLSDDSILEVIVTIVVIVIMIMIFMKFEFF